MIDNNRYAMENSSLTSRIGARPAAATTLLLFVASVLIAVNSLLSSPLMSLSTASGQTGTEIGTQDERSSSLLHSPLFTTSTPSSILVSMQTQSSNDFKLFYLKLETSTGSFQQSVYDSAINTLRINNISTAVKEDELGRFSFSQGQSQSQSNKQVSESDKNNLKQMITQDGFFQIDAMYPPPDAQADDNYNTLYVLNVGMDNRFHTAIWTDISENIPKVLLSIAKETEKLSSA